MEPDDDFFGDTQYEESPDRIKIFDSAKNE